MPSGGPFANHTHSLIYSKIAFMNQITYNKMEIAI